MALAVRAALMSDAPAIGTLAKQFADYLRGLGDETEFKLTAESFLRDGFGRRPAFEGFVVEERGLVVGYLLYHFGYDSDGAFRNVHIVDLYVEAHARKKGAGRALMMAAAAVAREAGAQEMIWSIYRANDLAVAFYERLGARKITELFFMKLPADAL
jgi:ribosomal protein S18 acetylase RimI-like enzyme